MIGAEQFAKIGYKAGHPKKPLIRTPLLESIEEELKKQLDLHTPPLNAKPEPKEAKFRIVVDQLWDKLTDTPQSSKVLSEGLNVTRTTVMRWLSLWHVAGKLQRYNCPKTKLAYFWRDDL